MYGVKKSSRFPSSVRSKRHGFTIIEVAVAGMVLALAISSSIIVLQHGIRAIDTARYTTLAGQILQGQMERIHMLTWTQLVDPTYGPAAVVSGVPVFPTFTPPPDVTSAAGAQINRFKASGIVGAFSQEITAPPSPWDTQMRIITLTANWTGIDGRPHTLTYNSRYAKNGISDFFYTSR